MSLRIAIAGIAHETNTYSPAATSVEDFEVHRGEEISDHFTGTSTTVGGMLAAAEQLGAVTVRLLAAQATPSGTIAAEAYDALSEEILAGIEAALPLDLVALDLHGAGVVGGIDDLGGRPLSPGAGGRPARDERRRHVRSAREPDAGDGR